MGRRLEAPPDESKEGWIRCLLLTCSKKDRTCPTVFKARISTGIKKTASIEAAEEAKRSRVEQFTTGDAKAPQKG